MQIHQNTFILVGQAFVLSAEIPLHDSCRLQQTIVCHDGLIVWLRVWSVVEVLQSCKATLAFTALFQNPIDGIISMPSFSGMHKSYSLGNVKVYL